MRRELTRLGMVWVLLMAIAGGEFLLSGRHIPMVSRPVLLGFALVMVFLVGLFFMRLYAAPTIAKGFAVAAMFWLIVLFGLGSMDALTRDWYPVAHYSPY
jgi:hypothetical protein